MLESCILIFSFVPPLFISQNVLLYENEYRGAYRTLSNIKDGAVFEKRSMLDVQQGSEYACGNIYSAFQSLGPSMAFSGF